MTKRIPGKRVFESLRALANRRVVTIGVLGFASGLPLALSGGTLQAWLAVAHVDIETIGLFSLVGLPYTLKFLWSPLMDRFVPPWLGRRRGWMLLCQIALVAAIASMTLLSPRRALMPLAWTALAVAFLSASQDIVIDAYRTDLLHTSERGFGAAVAVSTYRLAMVVSGGIALIFADQIGFGPTYVLMAALMSIGMIASWMGPEPEHAVRPPATLREAVREPLAQLLRRPGAASMLGLVLLYRLSDIFAGTLTIAFLIRGVGFTPTEVGIVNKGVGLAALLVGGLLGGGAMARLSMVRALWIFGILQGVTNLGFMLLALLGKSTIALVGAVCLENLAGGMGDAAFVAFLMALCDARFSATQYALLSALAAVPARLLVGPAAGFLAKTLGWPVFFALTALAALPGLALLRARRTQIAALEATEP